MKKNRLVIWSMLCLGTAFGQTFSLKTGAVLSRVTDFHYSEYEDTYVGLSLSLQINYLKRPHFYLSSNLGFVRAGGKGKVYGQWGSTPGPVVSYDHQTELNFVSLNTCYNFTTPLAENVHAFLGFGPRLDYLVSYNDESTYNSAIFENYDKGNDLVPLQFGLSGAAGVHFSLNKLLLGVSLEYHKNLSNLVYTATFDSQVNYAVIGLSLGYDLGE